MAKFLKVDIDEERLSEMSETSDIDEGVEREMGWANESGIYLEEIYDENEVIVLGKEMVTTSQFNPMQYAEACKKFSKIAHSVIETEGLFKSYINKTLFDIIKEEMRKQISENPLDEFAMAYVFDMAKKEIKTRRSFYKIDLDEEDVVEKATRRVKIMVEEFLSERKGYFDRNDLSEITMNTIYLLTKKSEIIFDEENRYSEKMQVIVDKIYDEIMNHYFLDLGETQQRHMLNELVKKGHISEDVANIILVFNNNAEESIISDENMEITGFGKALAKLLI